MSQFLRWRSLCLPKSFSVLVRKSWSFSYRLHGLAYYNGQFRISEYPTYQTVVNLGAWEDKEANGRSLQSLKDSIGYGSPKRLLNKSILGGFYKFYFCIESFLFDIFIWILHISVGCMIYVVWMRLLENLVSPKKNNKTYIKYYFQYTLIMHTMKFINIQWILLFFDLHNRLSGTPSYIRKRCWLKHLSSREVHKHDLARKNLSSGICYIYFICKFSFVCFTFNSYA